MFIKLTGALGHLPTNVSKLPPAVTNGPSAELWLGRLRKLRFFFDKVENRKQMQLTKILKDLGSVSLIRFQDNG